MHWQQVIEQPVTPALAWTRHVGSRWAGSSKTIRQPRRIPTHYEEVDGDSAMLWLAPQVNTTLIVLANVGGDTAKRLTQEISRVVVGSLP